MRRGAMSVISSVMAVVPLFPCTHAIHAATRSMSRFSWQAQCAPYVPAGQRVAEAIAKNPEKSNLAIAAELGVTATRNSHIVRLRCGQLVRPPAPTTAGFQSRPQGLHRRPRRQLNHSACVRSGARVRS
jgi:hypothetical protein